MIYFGSNSILLPIMSGVSLFPRAEAFGHIPTTVKKQGVMIYSHTYLTFSILCNPGSQTKPCVTTRVSASTPINLTKTVPHSHTQSPVSQEILDVIKLTTVINNSYFIFYLKYMALFLNFCHFLKKKKISHKTL